MVIKIKVAPGSRGGWFDPQWGRIVLGFPGFIFELLWVHTRACSVVLRVSHAMRALVSPISSLAIRKYAS
uniref:Uncharacterized protein n=1 Tax=Setaria viridis TaxID=4556 RepID=A0A4U6TDS3_SETVI|nr:hypothetical protein SEVIR_8G098300v2 [Setaria viridis]